MSLIPSAVDSELFRPDAAARTRLSERFKLPDDARICGMAAQFIARKGHDLLLPLVSRVRAEVPGLRLLLFGQGPERERFERDVHAAGLDQTIVFCGFEPDWPELLPGLDLLLHPARREGLGVVVLEAMSAGVPVVASAAGGIVDVIDPGVDGELLLPGDVSAWTRTVVSLLRDSGARERLATAARKKVESDYTIEAMADRYIALYDAVRMHRV
jgi:glycosyltransferase involved in cell wall biosynthesis